MLISLQKDVQKIANPEKAKILARFFKTGKGEYGEGDQFIGLTVPQSRKIAVQYQALSFSDVSMLLQSPIHEERLIALLLLVHNFQKGDEKKKKEIYEFYLAHTRYINNWDLVDLSSDKIVGGYLLERDRTILYHLADSTNIWERRIAVLATFHFIKEKKEDADIFAIAEVLLHDQDDLIQKAVGWMLREVGKRISEKKLEEFLLPRYKHMPRTMLRYTIERFPEEKRKRYLLKD
jgi:3-methyladenine DNA glycosylase AlkD